MTKADFFAVATPVGEFTAGAMVVYLAIIWTAAAWWAPDSDQTRLRLWIVGFAMMFGFEEIVDSMFHEGDPQAQIPHFICTVGQCITAGKAALMSRRIKPWQWRKSYEGS